jgi:hypothetical protein
VKELRLPLLGAAAGILVLVFLFRTADPMGRFPVSIDRTQAIQRARRLSETYGLSTTGWRADVITPIDEKLRAYREAHPSDPAARLFTPLEWGVLLTAPDGRTIRTRLSADGRPMQWEYRKLRGGSPLPPLTLPGAAALADFAGSSRPQFHSVDLAPQAGGARRQSWEWSAGPGFPLVAQLSIARIEGEEYSITLDQRYEREFQPPADRPAARTLQAISVLLTFLGFCAALFWCVSGWVRGAFTWRAPPVWRRRWSCGPR